MDLTDSMSCSQFLTFTLAEELFALHIVKVREVLDFTTATKVPNTPRYLRGVINLRGNVLPVVDMRLKLGLQPAAETVNSCIIIVEVEMEGDTVLVGIVADAVQEVLDLEPQDIEPPPRIGTKLDTEFIVGIGKHNEQFLMILHIDAVLAAEASLVVQESVDELPNAIA